ncbi:MAG: rhodanese-like domain-containing protein [Williamsia sp.]|nr:rhodanese-like domain-containing protein [Williamsia sp.]
MRPVIFFLFVMLIFNGGILAQDAKEPWNSSQLLEPATLAFRIDQNQTDNLLILSVGPGAVIKGSVDIGPAHELENMEKLKDYLKNTSKDKEVVIYCGCCPFDKCPNIRPAFKVLQELGLKNAKLLNIAKNVKTDWLDKNYPVNQ